MRVLGWATLVGSSQQQWALSLTLTLFGTPTGCKTLVLDQILKTRVIHQVSPPPIVGID